MFCGRRWSRRIERSNLKNKCACMKKDPQHANLLLFELLEREKGITHFSTTRTGGVSTGAYSSFNMGNFSDDSPVNIHENRKILARMFYVDMRQFIIPHQTHSNRVLKIDEDFLALDSAVAIETLYGVDAVVSNLGGLFLCVTTADCVPIILYDRVRSSIAAIHAGWKGTSKRIVENTIVTMEKNYKTRAGDLVACIGPAISMDRYEVGDEVIEEFKNSGFSITDQALYRGKESGKYYIDLKEVNRRELIRLGVREEKIEKSNLCTYDMEELFFSARRQTVHSGRMLTGIMMNRK